MATLALLVVVVAGAGVGQSALGGSSQSGTLVDGTTDSITNIDPAGSYDYGTFTLEANFLEHLLDFRHGAKLEPSLATKCFSVGSLTTWRCNLRKRRDVQRRLGVRFDGREVLLRPGHEQDDREGGSSNSPSSLLGNLKSVYDEREVRSHVPSQVAPGHVAVHSRDAGGIHRALGHV